METSLTSPLTIRSSPGVAVGPVGEAAPRARPSLSLRRVKNKMKKGERRLQKGRRVDLFVGNSLHFAGKLKNNHQITFLLSLSHTKSQVFSPPLSLSSLSRAHPLSLYTLPPFFFSLSPLSRTQ
ncbi:unnamed protein product [Boreogadus saida]